MTVQPDIGIRLLRTKVGRALFGPPARFFVNTYIPYLAKVRGNPTKAKQLYNCAYQYYVQEDWYGVDYWTRLSIIMDPSLGAAYLLRGVAFQRSRHYEAAREAFQAGLEVAPEYVKLLSAFGDLEQEVGNHEAAKACYERALAVNPADQEVAAKLQRLRELSD